MKRIMRASLAASSLLALGLAVGPTLAASPNVEKAIKSLAKIEADATKFQAFCKLLRDLDDVPDSDTAKAEALEVQLDNLLRSIGMDVLQAWDLGAELDPASDDGKAFEAAMEELEEKCPD